MNMKNFKGFTLIELLVVISIIGVISSIVLVSFSGQRDKARLARAQQFDAQISHALGAYAVGIWRFEDISGGKVSDESGYGNDGNVSGAVLAVGKGAYPDTNALEFNSSDVVTIPNVPSLNNYTGLTLEAWINPSDNGLYGGIIDKYYYPGACHKRQFLFRRETDQTIRFWMGYNSGNNAESIGTDNKVNSSDGWAHVVATWNGSTNTMKVYLNGKEENSYTDSLSWTTNTSCNIQIGRYYTTSSYVFHGLIDNVRIYSEALSSSQIQQHYAQGAASHGIAVND